MPLSFLEHFLLIINLALSDYVCNSCLQPPHSFVCSLLTDQMVLQRRFQVILRSGHAGLWDGCQGWRHLMIVARVMVPMGLLLG